MEHPMAHSLLASVGAPVLALLLVSGLPDPVGAHSQSGPGHGGGYSGGGNFAGHFTARAYTGGPRFATHNYRNYGNYGHVHHSRHHRRIFIGVPYGYSDDYYYNGAGCYWLRRRALATGSHYWWNRYEACLTGYYDY
jgi:hypothetical protein